MRVKGELLMKGSLHTDELMRAVTSATKGLRTSRRISHVFVMDVPSHPTTLFITDAAINIFPDLDVKRDIIQNAIDLFTQVGLGTPKVAILSAVETVTSKIPTTIDAAALCKMADRGQITGGILDGPLAFDNAIDVEAARIKGIRSEVAGRADILVVPDIEAGNMLAKNLSFLAGADAAGIVLGARVPIVLTSRADFGADPASLVCCGDTLCGCAAPDDLHARSVIDMKCILVVNAGSSSVKFQVFALEGTEGLEQFIRGEIDGIGSRPRLRARDKHDTTLVDQTFSLESVPDVATAMRAAGSWLLDNQKLEIAAVGHRVVHGGPKYDRPTIIDDQILEDLARYAPLAPLHQPNNLTPIRAIRGRFPQLPQVACFDTAFHRGHDSVADHFAIPESLYAEGVRRYGFHGLSYEYIAGRLRELFPHIASGRVIVAHLGSGASMCALLNGRSVESTMGFTALDGLPMGTRSGQIDPGVILYLMAEKGMNPEAVQKFLYSECGLKGLSGISNDVRDLQSSREPGAILAIDYFVHRIGLHAGMLAAAIGGLDAFVFTAGIGERSPTMRARIAEKLAWLGAELIPTANASGETVISPEGSRVTLYVLPTNEELMIARHSLALLSAAADQRRSA